MRGKERKNLAFFLLVVERLNVASTGGGEEVKEDVMMENRLLYYLFSFRGAWMANILALKRLRPEGSGEGLQEDIIGECTVD